METTEILAALDRLSSMLDAYLAVRAAIWKNQLPQAERDQVAHAARRGSSIAQSVAITVRGLEIPQDGLTVIGSQVVEAEKRFQKAVQDPNHAPEQLDEEAKVAEAAICSFLQLVRRHNRDYLPGKLGRLWSAYGCPENP
jgi:hypothetical protein